MHIKSFDNVYKLNINKTNIFKPLTSKILNYKYLGEMTVEILKEAGYDNDGNGRVPGWVFQCANPWLGRLMDLRGISPTYTKEYPLYVYSTKENLIEALNNPTIEAGPFVGEDAHTIFCKSYEARKIIYDESVEMLKLLE